MNKKSPKTTRNGGNGVALALRAPAFPIILNIPHSSTVVPDDLRGRFAPATLTKELRVMTSHYTDELFRLGGAASVVAQISRLVVDCERFRNDADEVMADVGMGAVYTRTSDGRALMRSAPDAEYREAVLRRFYDPYHAELSAATGAALTRFGSALIVDCHSFASRPLPFERNRRSRPDICIGSDSYHTPQALVWLAKQFFEKKGYVTAVNSPYAGAIVPQRFFCKEPRVQSLMIEVNRGLYMEEHLCAKNAGFARLQAHISEFLACLAALATRVKSPAAAAAAAV